MECNDCGSEEFTEIHNEEYSGHKGSDRNRNETEKTIYECDDCGGEGREFVDGVDGGMTYSGVLR